MKTYKNLSQSSTQSKLKNVLCFIRQTKLSGKWDRLTRSQLKALKNRLIKLLRSLSLKVKMAACLSALVLSSSNLTNLTAQCTSMKPVGHDFQFGGFGTINLRPIPQLMDLDQDGDDDLISMGVSGARVYFNENGVFELAKESENPFSVIQGSVSGYMFYNLVGDENLDLVVGLGTVIRTYENNGGTFTLVPEDDNLFRTFNDNNNYDLISPYVVDFDGDGVKDLFLGTANNGIKYYQIEDPGWVEQSDQDNPFSDLTPGFLFKPTIKDYDQDGDHELLIGFFDSNNDGDIKYYDKNNQGDYVESFFGNSDPFVNVNAETPAPFLYDFLGDGKYELLVGDRDYIHIYNLNDDIVYEEFNKDPFMDVLASDISFGDLDLDGSEDIIASYVDYYSKNGIIYKKQLGSNSPFINLSVSDPSSYTPHFVDFDGDGDLDVIHGQKDGQVLLNNNSGNVFISLPPELEPIKIDAGDYSNPFVIDFNEDGYLDIFVAHDDLTSSISKIKYYEFDETIPFPNSQYILKENEDDPFRDIDFSAFSVVVYKEYFNESDSRFVAIVSPRGIADDKIRYYSYDTIDNLFVEASDNNNPFSGYRIPNSKVTLGNLSSNGQYDVVFTATTGRLIRFVQESGSCFEIPCDTPNVWIGAENGEFAQNPDAWSLGRVPVCDRVIINQDAQVIVDQLNTATGNTLEINTGATFDVNTNTIFCVGDQQN